jgi:hypothetical protein
MSADTFVLVDKKTFKVYMCTASCSAEKYFNEKDMVSKQCRLEGRSKSLKGALKIAEKLDSEYGISFSVWCK